MSKYNAFDESEYNAFRDNESRIKTDDSDPEEHSYENLDPEMKIFNTDDRYYSDTDPGL